MATELLEVAEHRGAATAIDTIEDTLAVIAEREDAGYVTVAMLDHRVRLLGLERRLTSERGAHGRGVAWAPPSRGLGPVVRNDRVAVRVELSTHGEATEIVRGKEKLLRASFRLGMEIENLTLRDLTLERPVIDARVPFPIERWYVVGQAGEPWDGKLPARSTNRINVVGYLGEPVKPGVALDATIGFASLELGASTVTQKRWNEQAL